MILKRTAEAIRKQDWSTITIEFLIVVIGIFAGLQANDWTQEQQDRKSEQAALDRLFNEMQVINRELDEFIDRTKRRNDVRRAALGFVESDAPVPDNETSLKIGINTLANFPPVIPVTAVYQELQSSGQFQLIQNPGLRADIAEFHAGLEWLNQVRAGFRAGTDQFWQSYQRNITWDYNPQSTTSDILISTYNWGELRRDEAFKFAAIGLLRNQLVAELALIDLQRRAISVCQNLGQELGKECESADQSAAEGPQ